MKCICPRKNALPEKEDFVQALRFCSVQFIHNSFQGKNPGMRKYKKEEE